MRARGIFCLLLIAFCLRSFGVEKDRVACTEAQLAAAVLSKQNDMLRIEVGRLRDEIAKLTTELAIAKAGLDEAKYARSVGPSAVLQNGSTLGGAATESWLIEDVNRDLRLVVLEAGRSNGLKLGMTMYALKSGKPGARLRVVDVREHTIGAVIEETLVAGSPARGDRVVLMMAPK